MNRWARTTYVALNGYAIQGRDTGPVTRLVSMGLMLLIAVSVIAVVAGTVPDIRGQYGPALMLLEAICLIVFSAEYLLRVWVAPCNPHYAHPVTGRLRYMVSPMAIIDLLAILPAVLMISSDQLVLRALRLLRLFRLAKLARHMDAMRLFGKVAVRVKYEMSVTALLAALLLLISSSVMYQFENEAQPEVFSSIPATMWWGITTLTTVGYGDTFPITPVGRIIGAVVAIMGIGLFALPTGILATAYLDELQSSKSDVTKQGQTNCPHCGKILDGSTSTQWQDTNTG